LLPGIDSHLLKDNLEIRKGHDIRGASLYPPYDSSMEGDYTILWPQLASGGKLQTEKTTFAVLEQEKRLQKRLYDFGENMKFLLDILLEYIFFHLSLKH